MVFTVAAWSVALIATAEVWTCRVDTNDAGYSYTTNYVINDSVVTEVGDLLTTKWYVLDNNERRVTFANSNYGQMDWTGKEIEQVASVVTIQKSTGKMHRHFVQSHGQRLDNHTGSCINTSV